MNHTVTSIAKRLFRLLGIELRRFPGMGSAEHWLNRVSPEVVFDVGANQGQYGQWLRKYGYCGSIVSFEPDADAFAVLKKRAESDGRWTCVNTAIGQSEGEIDMYVTGHASPTSSLLEPLELGYAVSRGSRKVRVSRLDKFVEQQKGSGQSIWLKSDTQGYDLEVLRSAGQLIREISCIQVECSLVENYAGQPLMHDLIRYCYEYGFVFSDLIYGVMNNGQLIECDVIFTKADRSVGRYLAKQ